MIDIAANIAIITLLVAMGLATVRLVKGPTLPDRVVALDLIAYLGLGLMIAFSVKSNNDIYIDFVMLASAIIFLGPVSIAIYLKKRKYDK